MKLLSDLTAELEADPTTRSLGTGWISGVLALVFAAMGLASVLILRYPQLLTTPEIRAVVDAQLFRLIVQSVLIVAFVLALISLILREKRAMGLTAITLILISVVLGGAQATQATQTGGPAAASTY